MLDKKERNKTLTDFLNLEKRTRDLGNINSIKREIIGCIMKLTNMKELLYEIE